MKTFHAILNGRRVPDPDADADPPFGPSRDRPPPRLPAIHGPPPPPEPLHTLRLSQVMSPPDSPRWMSEEWERHVQNGWGDLDRTVERYGLRQRTEPCDVPGYGIAHDLGGRVIAVIETATGRPVGGLFEGNLHVLEDHQGRGLAALVTELAFDVGLKRPGHRVSLSAGGRATRRAAHRRSVERALERGYPVRQAVLSDYPDLVGLGGSRRR